MRRRALLAAAAFLAACASEAPAPLTLTGELYHGPGNMGGSVRDCLTGEVFELGVMASTRHDAFFRRAEEVGAQRGGPPDAQVIVALEGEVSAGSPRVLAVSRVISMRRGTCDDPAQGG